MTAFKLIQFCCILPISHLAQIFVDLQLKVAVFYAKLLTTGHQLKTLISSL